MRLYVYLDESGSIHKNSNTKYFAVGGYFTFEKYRLKITSLYKKINKLVKDERKIKIDKEIKSYGYLTKEKQLIFSSMENIPGFYGFSKVFDKEKMQKGIVDSNIFYNYAVKLIFSDIIFPLLKNYTDEQIEIKLLCDNRNVRVGDLKNLENYLNTEFCLNNYVFSVSYYDSKTNFGIQLADLIVNTFYNYYANFKRVSKVIKGLNKSKYRVSLFPGRKVFGRIKKIDD